MDRDEGNDPDQMNPPSDERCDCGNLVAKIYDEAIEIKCRRCKRVHIIPFKRILKDFKE